MTVVKGLLGNELFDDMKQLKTVYENSYVINIIIDIFIYKLLY
jgi:hypothetical protein